MKITSNGQIALPPEIGERLGFLPDTEIEFEIFGDTLLLRKETTPKRGEELVALIKGTARTSMTTDEIMAMTRRETPMSHHHHHHDTDPHGHHHEGDTPGSMPLDQKLLTLLDHWQDHNADHAKTYTQWADRAEAKGMTEVAGMLREVAEITIALNEKFDAAAGMLQNRGE